MTPRRPTPPKRAAALRWEPGSAAVPAVIAAGTGAAAERIIELAFQAGVPVREDAGLAELLSAIEPDSPIPPEAVLAVAEIMSHVFRLDRFLRRSGEPAEPPASASDLTL